MRTPTNTNGEYRKFQIKYPYNDTANRESAVCRFFSLIFIKTYIKILCEYLLNKSLDDEQKLNQ